MNNLLIPDAFLLNTLSTSNPLDYTSLTLVQMDALRQCSMYRGRVYAEPDVSELPILPYTTYKTQIRVIPDSYVWGLSWVDTSSVTSASVAVQLTDTCTGLDFFSDFIVSSAFGTSAGFFSIGPNGLPTLLSKPKLIQAPGLINVQISNRSTGTSQRNAVGQLLVFTSEPVTRESLSGLAAVNSQQVAGA